MDKELDKPDPALISFVEPFGTIVGGWRSFRHPLHSWHLVRDTGVHRYLTCRLCGARKITHNAFMAVAQPLDQGWLATGEWTPMKPPPRAGQGDGGLPHFEEAN